MTGGSQTKVSFAPLGLVDDGCARLAAGVDDENSALGPVSRWSTALRNVLSSILPARVQIVLFWGPDFVALYNDAYAPTIGDKHPRAFGRPAVENWRELWDDLEPLLRRVRDGGETVFAHDRPFYIERRGFGEEVFFDISYSPVFDDDGSIGGVLCIVNETTDRIQAQRKAIAERERLAEMFKQAPGFMAVLEGPDHVFSLTNAAYQRLIGDREVLGKPVRDAVPEFAEQGFLDLLDRVYATGEPFTGRGMATTLRRAPGESAEQRALDFIYQPIRDRSGRVTGIFVEGADVTEQIRAVEAQRQSEDRLRLATEAAAIGTWDYNLRTGELRWDRRCRELFGAWPDRPITYEDAFLPGLHPEDRDRVEAAVRQTVSDRADFDVEYRTRGLDDGVERWLAARGKVVADGSPAGRFVGTVIDISGRKQAEAALIASEKALREESNALEILNRTAARIAAELDLDKLVQAIVDAGVELTGAEHGAFFYNVLSEDGDSYTLFTLSGAPTEAFSGFPMPRATKLFAPTFRGEGLVRCADVTADPRYGQNAPRQGMPDGHLRVRSYLAVPVISRGGEVIGGLFFGHPEVGVFDERTERLISGLAAQSAIAIDNARLFQAEQKLNRTLEARVAERTRERDRIWRLSRDPFLVADRDGRWLSVSPAWTELLGWTPQELLGRTSEWMEHPDDRPTMRDWLASLAAGENTTPRLETRFRGKTGHYCRFSWTAVAEDGLFYCVARDVTREIEAAEALREAEEALRQAQKMETVGQLTGGVAHDFNNLLQIVTGNLEILQRNLPEDSPRLRRAAENAMTGARRATVLTQRLLAFSRRQPLQPKPTDVNRLLAGMSELLSRTLGEIIEVAVAPATDLWRVEVDPNELENALLNLAINARDAMLDGGRLTIETANATIGAGMRDVAPGDYVVISVADTGVGMSPEVLERAFEPFFTTKEVGKGTGLGLSMVYGFVRQSGGHVKAFSEPGRGATMRIYLPRLVGDGSCEIEEPQPEPVEPKRGSDETILVCEDDDHVRAYSVGVLRELGYHVLEAHDGPSALRLLERQDGGAVDMLFTDVVLPGGMTGAVLAQRARALRPDLRVLFTSGYARDAIVHHGRLDPGVELITKPFTFTNLAARVRAVLDGGAPD
ncbi:PAS domain-containing protein [Hansschlegelia sp.]|uniref:PAS domain-containing protein n=1 Tax=Hansschlegelia sp. TaxID=2041892 RepID=UPI002BA7326B|nr:PAS domain-containing protein [Hansschlegelia sp.]HVI28164.1 PAS domain-containing protein [Hansschlegelia sp.]